MSTPTRPITTVIADDHAVVRDGLRTVLERTEGEFEVVAEAADLPAAVAAVREHRPHLLILDVTMPGGPSLGAVPELLSEQPDLTITVLTMHEDPGYARAALQAGAHSFVLKQAEPDELLRAFRIAGERGSYVDPRVGAMLVDTDNEATSNVLQYCAGTRPQVADTGKFFLLTSPNQIITTFNQIGVGLSKLRLAN